MGGRRSEEDGLLLDVKKADPSGAFLFQGTGFIQPHSLPIAPASCGFPKGDSSRPCLAGCFGGSQALGAFKEACRRVSEPFPFTLKN